MTLLRKIYRLQQLLVKEKSDFEQLAGQVNDNALRCTILSLAQQTNQYATELFSYMQSARTPVLPTGKPLEPCKHVFADERGALAFCNTNEKKLVVAYRRILKEATRYDGLQKMMGYQLTGILSASMQIKLLSSLKKRYHAKRLGTFAQPAL